MRRTSFFRWFRVLPILAMLAVCALTLFAQSAPASLLRNLLYPVEHAERIEAASARHGVDPYLVCAVIKCESNWNSDASSTAGALGLMQVMPETAEEVAGLGLVDRASFDPQRLTDPDTNIEYGVAYLGYLQRALSSQDEVIAAYNAGVGSVGDWLSGGGDLSSSIRYAETAAYLARVKDAQARYEELYPRGISSSS
ncbi:lytic transglycosylase domain-containing protein [Olsenella urininfantis]|uniref:lytic transglycosylase domain-containing protein n=1 Tax=Olsenella urininfantis TaxID=1871033 RepID=UPI0009858F5A|nr:lytic transglycosylase domain-containing protein [Olsenella urininfantis]